MNDLSPFEHVPELPAAGLTLGPLIGLTAVAAIFAGAGVAGLQRRDIG